MPTLFRIINLSLAPPHAGTELIAATFENVTVTSIYKPPPEKLTFPPELFDMNQNNIIIGYFTSHNHLCGYREDDENDLFLEDSISTNNLHLIHDSKLPNTFNSGRWKRGYNLDLACMSQNIRDIYYVIGECTTTYLAHNTALMGLRSTPQSPLRSSLSVAAIYTTTKRPTGKLSALPLTMAPPL